MQGGTLLTLVSLFAGTEVLPTLSHILFTGKSPLVAHQSHKKKINAAH